MRIMDNYNVDVKNKDFHESSQQNQSIFLNSKIQDRIEIQSSLKDQSLDSLEFDIKFDQKGTQMINFSK